MTVFKRKKNLVRKEIKPRMAILTCGCGNKYIKTRAGQITCVTCLNKALPERS